MPLQFTVLASGSGGNASLLEANGFGVLIDAGLGPRQLSARLTAVGASWQRVSAVLLTHTHTDHWNERTLEHLRRHRIPLHCHPGHHEDLGVYSSAFPGLHADGLAREDGVPSDRAAAFPDPRPGNELELDDPADAPALGIGGGGGWGDRRGGW